jgi:DeoR/GlpR family transcriptional regulator of sugar metabolism
MWNESDGEYSSALSRNSYETYVVADSSKFGKESFYKFLEFSQVDHLITDDANKLDDAIVNAAGADNVKIHIVKSKY